MIYLYRLLHKALKQNYLNIVVNAEPVGRNCPRYSWSKFVIKQNNTVMEEEKKKKTNKKQKRREQRRQKLSGAFPIDVSKDLSKEKTEAAK